MKVAVNKISKVNINYKPIVIIPLVQIFLPPYMNILSEDSLSQPAESK